MASALHANQRKLACDEPCRAAAKPTAQKRKSPMNHSSNKTQFVKTRTKLASAPAVAAWRGITARGALALLALAATIIPAMASDGPQTVTGEEAEAIRPFHVNVPKSALVNLRRRLNATQWPDKETVSDESQGVQLATMKKLVRYWETDYDWRKVEAKLNSYPQFVTEIDGLDIHFIHVRSRHANALPIIITH